MKNAMRITAMLFVVWLGVVLFLFAQNGRYKAMPNGSILDSRTGVEYADEEPAIQDLML